MQYFLEYQVPQQQCKFVKEGGWFAEGMVPENGQIILL